MERIKEISITLIFIIAFAIAVYLVSVRLNEISIQGELDEKESKKEMIYSVIRLSSTNFENKADNFIEEHDSLSMEQLDSLRPESDKEVKLMLSKILNENE